MELRNFYTFLPLTHTAELKEKILAFVSTFESDTNGIKGTILLAPDGINAAISSHTIESLVQFQAFVETLLGVPMMPLITNLSALNPEQTELPFRKFKVKLKPSIVALGVEGLDPACSTGVLVEPEHWNELITDPRTITIDTRNTYEYLIGHFKGAVDPQTPNFTDFASYVENMNETTSPYDKIAMYCTGGIRCEMATSYMINLNIKNTYQLHGGILGYFQKVPPAESLWEGVCFVFDDRIAVDNTMKSSVLEYKNLPQALHSEQHRNRHSGHIYKKILSITQ